ncbi:MAG: riboflavin synthase [Aaplasma endosymbiont of Hyalomma asiaticum]
MFSGIVAAIGSIAQVYQLSDADLTVHIAVPNCEFLSQTVVGGSVACSGVCLTVVEKGMSHFIVNVSKDTLDTTNLKFWSSGTRVNLETSLKLGAPIDGHIVQGHVDCMGQIHSLKQIAGSYSMEISHDISISKYIAPKGSVALDGVSLTVNSVKPGLFRVNLIPHTWHNTAFQHNVIGDWVNIETDLIARHLEALFISYNTQGS